MEVNRRQFVVLTLAAAAGCASEEPLKSAPTGDVDIGPAGDFPTDGVYDRFRQRGVFIVRQGGQLTALSSLCTHRHCLLKTASNGSFHCPCHGSTFDPAGKVTKGPARDDLPIFPIEHGPDGHLHVRRPA